MITKEQAIMLKPGDTIHCGNCKKEIGPRGGKKIFIEQWRINGKIKLWKTRPGEFQLPIKYGLKYCSYLNERNHMDFHLASECPIEIEQLHNETL